MGVRISNLTETTTMADANTLPTDTTSGTRRISWANIVALLQPVGTVIQTARTTAPTGFLACDGAAVSRTTYANLFSAIGTTYGAGNGSTTFNLPDLRGLFVRGAGAHGTMTKAAGGAFDGGSVGATSNDSMQGHWHQVDKGDLFVGGSSVTRSAFMGDTAAGLAASDQIRAKSFVSDGTNGTPRTGNETKPASMSLLYCIKY